MEKIRSVMVVDDYEPDARYAALMLERSGRFGHVMHVRGAEEALELYEGYTEARKKDPNAFPPLVMLLDINMPRMNGFEFLQAYRSLLPSLPDEARTSIVMMLSSSMSEADRARAEAFDVVHDFVTKPLTVEKAHAIADSIT